MKALALGLGGLGLVVLAAGCQPELAGVKYGEEEQQWEQYVDRSYSGFKPPRTAPPAIVDKFSPKATETPLASEAVTPPPAEETVVTETEVVEEVVTDTPPADDVDAAADKRAEPKNTPAKPEQPAPDAAKTETSAPAGKTTVYIVKPGDTLSYIAQKVYKDGRKYEAIIKANPVLLKNPNFLKPGMKLQIPQL